MSTSRQPLIEMPETPEALPDVPIKIQNRLAEHPLFEPERIKELLRRLPRKHVEIRAVEHSGSHDGGYMRGPMLADDPVEAFERLEERPTWMLLHETWKFDDDYKALLDEYLADLGQRFPEAASGISHMGCWMFMSSGGSVVHFHSDDDQSFLNNVRGGKTVYVYPAKVLPETVIENLLLEEDQGAVVYDPAYEEHILDPVHIGPGESVFLPLYAPHRVTNDDTICISWNVGFNTRQSRRRRKIHLVNKDLRTMGFEPSPYGASAWRDAIKSRMHFPVRVKNKLLRMAGLASRARPTADRLAASDGHA